MRKKEAQKVEANSQKIVYLFVEQERLKKQPKNQNLRPKFYAQRKHAKKYPFWTTFQLCIDTGKKN